MWPPEGDFQVAYDAADADVAEAFAAWEAEIAHGRRIEVAAESLDVVGVDCRSGEEYSLRRILIHLVQEYARTTGTPTSSARASTAPPGSDQRLRAQTA